jgi:hypothetical protein
VLAAMPAPPMPTQQEYVLALFAQRFGIELHVATCLSTHFHLVVTVPNEDVSELMHRIDMHLACALQVLRWAAQQLGSPIDPADVMRVARHRVPPSDAPGTRAERGSGCARSPT